MDMKMDDDGWLTNVGDGYNMVIIIVDGDGYIMLIINYEVD
jgi:hypothetical protein